MGNPKIVEPISRLAHGDEDTRDLERRRNGLDFPPRANHQAVEAGEQAKGPFDFPAPLVAPQRVAVLGLQVPSLAMQADQLNAAIAQSNAVSVGAYAQSAIYRLG